jgi:hypothetical protein
MASIPNVLRAFLQMIDRPSLSVSEMLLNDFISVVEFTMVRHHLIL